MDGDISHNIDSELSRYQRIINRLSITPLGLASIVVGAWVYDRFGQQEQDYLLYMSGLAFALFSLIVFMISYLEQWRLKRSLAGSHDHLSVEVEVGQDLLTGFTLPSIPTNPLFQLRVSWYRPSAREYHLELFNGVLQEVIKPQRRGKVVQVTREFILEDIFGFTALKWYQSQNCDLKVSPQTVSANELRLHRPQRGEDFYDPIGEPNGDLIEMRRYEDGDPLKWIMWRVYARNRQLVVRSPERALSEKRDLVAYFLADSTDEGSASTARAYIEGGLLGEEYLFIADGCRGQAQTANEVMNHLMSSVNAEPLSSLPELLALPAQQQRGVILFASALSPTETIMSAASALPSHPLVILSLPFQMSEVDTTLSPWWTKLFKALTTQEERLSIESLQRVVETVEQLSATREPLLIAHPSGRLITRGVLNDLSLKTVDGSLTL